MKGLVSLAREKNLVLLEDTCESLGTIYDGKYAGAFGLAASYSFYFSHHITTVEGGMIVTDDDEYAELLRTLRAHGWTRHLKNKVTVEAQYPDLDNRFLFVNTGFNVRATDVQAAIGIEQLKKLKKFNRERVRVAKLIRKELEVFSEHIEFVEPSRGAEHTWFGFPFLLKGAWAGRSKELAQQLTQLKVENRPIVAGNLAKQPFLKHFAHRVSGSLPGANRIMESGIYIGSHPNTTLEQIKYLKSAMTKVLVVKPSKGSKNGKK